MTHLIAVAHAVAAAVAAAAIFHLAGAALLRKRSLHDQFGLQSPITTLLPGLLGAALYIVAAWIAVTSRAVPLLHVILVFTVSTVVLALVRRRAVLEWSQSLLSRESLIGLGLFAALLALAYSCSGRAADSLDAIAQATHARQLLETGSSRTADGVFRYQSHPAVVFMLGALSPFHGFDPLSAAVPLQIAADAAFGLCVVSIARTVFGLAPIASMLVAALAMTSVLHRSVASSLDLTSVCSSIPIVFLVWCTGVRASHRRFDPVLSIAFGASYAVLWFADPIALVMATVTHAAAVAARVASETDRRQAVTRFGLAAVVPIFVLGAAFYQTTIVILGTLGTLVRSSSDPTSVVTPFAILGWPGALIGSANGASLSSFPVLGFGLIAAALFACAVRGSRMFGAAERVFMLTAGWVFLIHAIGSSTLWSADTQMRIASTVVPPLAFVPLAAIARLATATAILRRPADDDLKLVRAFAAYAALGMIVGNVALHAAHRSPIQASAGPWDALRVLGDRRYPMVTVQLRRATPYDRALAGYYFPGARATFIDSTRDSNAIPVESISETTPLFVEHLDCRDVGHGDVIGAPRFGCVLLNAPGAKLDVTYPFNRPLLFVRQSGMTQREPGGRWNTGADMEWEIGADAATEMLDRPLYLNVSLNPFLPNGVPPPRLRFRFRNGDAAELAIERETTLSVPVGPGDWLGSRLWTLPLFIQFPDGRTMLFHEMSLTVDSKGTVVKRTTAASAPASL